jgi:hypothetical protein
MRKLLIFIFFALSCSLMAQPRLKKSEVYFGVNGGITGSMIGFTPTVDQSYLTGYNGGIVFRYIGDKYMGLQAELNYSQRGWAEKSGLFSKQLNYIELPFLTHMYLGNKSRVFFNIGPKISYLLSEKNLISNLDATDDEAQHKPVQNTFDYGLCGGFGYLFYIRKNVFQLDTRFYYSLSDIYSNAKRDYFAASKNLNVSANLGWLIQVK